MLLSKFWKALFLIDVGRRKDSQGTSFWFSMRTTFPLNRTFIFHLWVRISLFEADLDNGKKHNLFPLFFDNKCWFSQCVFAMIRNEQLCLSAFVNLWMRFLLLFFSDTQGWTSLLKVLSNQQDMKGCASWWVYKSLLSQIMKVFYPSIHKKVGPEVNLGYLDFGGGDVARENDSPVKC